MVTVVVTVFALVLGGMFWPVCIIVVIRSDAVFDSL